MVVSCVLYMKLRASFILLVFLTGVLCEENGGEPTKRMGHMEPLGNQHECLGSIESRNDLPGVEEFFETYVKGSKPVVFKGAASNIPAYKLWTDQYLMKNFGDVKCEVESGKKENRSNDMYDWTYSTFLENYKNYDVYMVNSLPAKMRADLRLFPFMACGGYTQVLSDVIMWFSSGGTKSVVHNDGVDNINCLFSGTKQMYMAHWKYAKHIDFDTDDNSHSLVDVDAVDLDKYPGYAHVPWWNVTMETGDCLFIPTNWYHQVKSYATEQRNMAVNTWFYNMKNINFTDCVDNPNAGKYIPMDTFKMRQKEGVRFVLKLDIPAEEEIGKKEMAKIIMKHLGERSTLPVIKAILKVLDKNKDKKFSAREIDELNDEELAYVARSFAGFEDEWGDTRDEREEIESESNAEIENESGAETESAEGNRMKEKRENSDEKQEL